MKYLLTNQGTNNIKLSVQKEKLSENLSEKASPTPFGRRFARGQSHAESAFTYRARLRLAADDVTQVDALICDVRAERTPCAAGA